MKRIKLVISDFHIGRGRYLVDGSINVLEDFFQQRQFSEFLEFYSTNKYSKYHVELIINGDFFNFLQIDYEGKFHSVITESLSVFQLEAIIDGWPVIFDDLRRFNESDLNNIAFITGNHDPQLLWDAVRNRLRERIGGKINFHDLQYEFDGFHIEHGHQLDIQNCYNPKKLFLYRNTPEPIINVPWGTRFCIEHLSHIKKLNPIADKIIPFRKFLTWSLFHDTRFAFYAALKTILYLLKSFLFPGKYFRTSFIELYHIVTNISFIPKLDRQAKQLLKNDRLHTVILGHTHQYRFVQHPNDKESINTGTWTKITSLNLTDLGTRVFLTYAIIEYPEDSTRPRAKLKRWRGSWKITEDIY